MKRLVLAGILAATLLTGVAARAVEPHAVTASGPLAVLNGLAAFDLQATDLPLGIPAPSGAMVIAYQSTFEPPGPHVVVVKLMCVEFEAFGLEHTLYASGDGNDGNTWYVKLHAPAYGLASFSWSTTASTGACGAPVYGGIPVLGPVVFTP